MTTRDTILKELHELGSTLLPLHTRQIYEVPQGYFEELPGQLLKRIKALEATEEQAILSPELEAASKKNPFTVPEGYFDTLSDTILELIRKHANDFQSKTTNPSSREEIETLSPLLSKISREMPYQVPAGYFETIQFPAAKKEQPKVIPLFRRKIYRFAAAAIFLGIVLTGGLLILRQKSVDPNQNPQAWVEKNVEKKVNPQLLEEFISLAKADEDLKDLNENEPVRTEEIKELMKDVPENEIQEFLNETVALESNDASDALLN